MAFRTLGALTLLAALTALPCPARAVAPVALYLASERLTADEAGDVRSLLELAIRAAERRGVLVPAAPTVLPRACGPRPTDACLAGLTQGLVFLASAARYGATQVEVTAQLLDGRGVRTASKTFVLDLDIQTYRPADLALQELEGLYLSRETVPRAPSDLPAPAPTAPATVILAPAAAPARPPPGYRTPEPVRKVSPVSFVLGMGYDLGSTKLVSVELSDGSKQVLRANQGFCFLAGLAILRLPAGTGEFDTLATIGVKGWEAGADDGEVSYLGVPLEVLERFTVSNVRLGFGVSYVTSPRYKSKGVLEGFFDVEVENSLGMVGQLEWVSDQQRGVGRFGVGMRYAWQDFEASATGEKVGANSLGFLLLWES